MLTHPAFQKKAWSCRIFHCSPASTGKFSANVVLVDGAERNPQAVNLLKQAADKKKHVKALVSSNEYSSKGIQKILIHSRKHRLQNAEQQ